MDVSGYLPYELLSADPSCISACLWLKLHQVVPHVLSRVGVVADLGVGVEAEHVRGVGQGQGLNGVYV